MLWNCGGSSADGRLDLFWGSYICRLKSSSEDPVSLRELGEASESAFVVLSVSGLVGGLQDWWRGSSVVVSLLAPLYVFHFGAADPPWRGVESLLFQSG